MSQPDVFLRRTSGVIRTLSPRDAMFYGYLVIAGLYGVSFYFFAGPALFPGANVYLAMVILLVLFAIRWVTYSGLISAMPRSGGDYVFSSRLLAGVVGFVITNAGMVWWQVFWDYLAGNAIALTIIPAMFDFVGHATGNPSLIQIGMSFANPWVACAIAIILLWIACYVMLTGLRAYVVFQNYFIMVFGVLSIAIIAAMFLVIPQSNFIGNFNTYVNLFQSNPDWYHSVISQAKDLGFNPNVGFSWGDTLGLAALYYGLWSAVSFGMELVGEIKGVQSFKTAWVTQFGAIILQFITFAVAAAWAQDYMGPEFIRSLGFLVVSGQAPPGFSYLGSYSLFAAVSMNPLIAVIIGLGFAGAMGNSLFNGFLGASRILLAQSFDRLLPGWVGHVNKRGAPDNILITLTALSSVAAVILTGYPSLGGLLQLALMCQFIAFAGSVLGGIIFPWKAKTLYESSPASKYKIAGLPAITICGIVGLATDIWAVWMYFTNPNYGIWPGTTMALGFAALLYIVPFVWYFINKQRRASQGINVELAFKEVPPA
jgi:APA family basic amino acid/polyamine antiporter